MKKPARLLESQLSIDQRYLTNPSLMASQYPVVPVNSRTLATSLSRCSKLQAEVHKLRFRESQIFHKFKGHHSIWRIMDLEILDRINII